ncbi:MAG: hypothetical protein ACRCYU_06645 [Nocardioides sp.]
MGPVEEAVGLWRVLAGADPGVHTDNFVISLGNYAGILDRTGSPAGAEQARWERASWLDRRGPAPSGAAIPSVPTAALLTIVTTERSGRIAEVT